MMALWMLLCILPELLMRQNAERTISEIRIFGNQRLNHESVISMSGLRVGDRATQSSLAQARKWLLASGMFGMHSNPPEEGVRITLDTTAGRTSAIVYVDENDVIRGLNIAGAGPLKPEEVSRALQSLPGALLNLPILQADINRIQQLYMEKGYTARVTEELGMKDGILKIPIGVDPLGTFVIEGVSPAESARLEREIRRRVGPYLQVFRFRRALNELHLELAIPTPGVVQPEANPSGKPLVLRPTAPTRR